MALADRIVAAAYDPVLARAERGWLGRSRRRLLGQLHGTVVELGAGTGANLRHATQNLEVARWIATEPTAAMRLRLEPRAEAAARRLGVPVGVVAAPAEALPLDEGSVDTVLSTLTLCTVQDPQAALAEVRRVLAPGGQLVLLEHVASHGAWFAVQRAVEPVWRRLARGCHLTRDLERLLVTAGFSTTSLRVLGGESLAESRRRGAVPMVEGSTHPTV